MKIIKILLFLILISSTTHALNDINISVESGSVQICISEKYLQNQTCNKTTPIILDGSKDHIIYITPEIKVKYTENDYQENLKNYFFYFVSEPIYQFYGIIFLLSSILIGVKIVQIFNHYIDRSKYRG